MTPVVVLDAGPLGLASKPRGNSEADRCRVWIRDLTVTGFRVVVPEIADYEIRRELIRAGATTGVHRLEQLEALLDYDPITTAAMRRAADLWALVRRAGVPTADPHALDGDCILAAQASLLGGPGDIVTIATTNAGHLGRFPGIEAQSWEAIKPGSLGVSVSKTVEFFNNTTLEDVINKHVDVYIRTTEATMTGTILCQTFVRDGRLWIDFIPDLNRKYVSPVPDDAIISRNETNLEMGRYAIFLTPTSPAGKMFKALDDAAKKNREG